MRARRAVYESELADYREIVRRFGPDETMTRPEVRDALEVAKQIRQVVAEASSRSEGS